MTNMTPDKKLQEAEEKRRKDNEDKGAKDAGLKSLRGGEDLKKILP